MTPHGRGAAVAAPARSDRAGSTTPIVPTATTTRSNDVQTLIVTFHLAGLDDAAYREQAAAMAPMFAAIPGLLAKIWLANAETNTDGDVYAFADRPSLDAYLDSEIVRSMRTSPHHQNVAIRACGTVEPATRTTRRHRPGSGHAGRRRRHRRPLTRWIPPSSPCSSPSPP